MFISYFFCSVFSPSFYTLAENSRAYKTSPAYLISSNEQQKEVFQLIRSEEPLALLGSERQQTKTQGFS